ncbi:MAG: helix-turn-helix domain-containing protein [Methanolobus sp.]
MGDNEESTNSDKVLILPLSEDSKKIAQILSNEKAMKMLEILADKPMSASDVAEKLELPLTTVKYNLDGLIEADLIQVKETKWSQKGREVKIYEPVQKLIVVAPGSMKRQGFSTRHAEKIPGTCSRGYFCRNRS